MKLFLHNTLNKRKEEFIPIDKNNVCMYVCGPTVYNRAHIGNARAAVVFDTLFRVLRYIYGEKHVTYASNITDVDDKIIAQSMESGESIDVITKRAFEWYVEDLELLNVMPPNIRPKATEHIKEMIELVEVLIEKGHAYKAEGHVLFDVSSMKDYGYLSRRDMKDMMAGARVDVAGYKRNPADFVLWKPAEGAEPGWKSPWGFGRPGWHLECSAMSSKYLGNSFDIHGGGTDLVFPHHENECAQSMCAHPNDSYARYWVHSGMLQVDGTKMSKSLGNFYSVPEVLETYHGEVLRFAYMSTHYKQPYNYTIASMDSAKGALDKFYTAIRGVSKIEVRDGVYNEEFINAMLDDLNTPMAVSVLHKIAGDLNKAKSDEDKQRLKSELVNCGHMIGVLYDGVDDWFRGKSNEGGLSDGEIDQLIIDRAEARKNKDWAKSDEIRDKLAEAGIILEDGANGTSWKRK